MVVLNEIMISRTLVPRLQILIIIVYEGFARSKKELATDPRAHEMGDLRGEADPYAYRSK